MNDRAQSLLKALIEKYIAEGTPIGSRTLSQLAGIDISPATIRHVLSELETLGFLESPHTSAGRIPTRQGYQFFIDSLLTIQPVETSIKTRLAQEVEQDTPQKALKHVSTLLSELTQFASIIVMPEHAKRYRHFEFLALSEKRILMILVTQEGEVENRILHINQASTSMDLARASNYLNQHHIGKTLEEIDFDINQELGNLQKEISQLMQAAVESSQVSRESQYLIAGEHQLLKSNDLSQNIETLRNLFQLFEQKSHLLELMNVGQQSPGVHIYLGEEAGILPVKDCAMVLAQYQYQGEIVGSLGVIGPSRMAYQKVIPIVDLTAKLLSHAMQQHLQS